MQPVSWMRSKDWQRSKARRSKHQREQEEELVREEASLKRSGLNGSSNHLRLLEFEPDSEAVWGKGTINSARSESVEAVTCRGSAVLATIAVAKSDKEQDIQRGE